MSGAVDFRALLATPTDEITKPKPLPAGTFIGSVKSFEYKMSKEKKTPYVQFVLTVSGPGPDIDPSEMDGVDLSKKSLRKDFYLTADAAYRYKEFAESCEVRVAGMSLGELAPELIGHDVLIEVTQRNSQDGSEIYNDVGNLKGYIA